MGKKIARFIPFVIIMLCSIGMVMSGVESLLFSKYLRDKADTNLKKVPYIEGLKNPNHFDDDYFITNDPAETMATIAYDQKRYIMEIYDELGIQVYFVNYIMNHEHRGSKKEVREEVISYVNDVGLNPYGIYHIEAEYAYEDEDGNYISCSDCWDTELNGFIIKGSKVDEWWDTSIQKTYDNLAEYVIGYSFDLDVTSFAEVLSLFKSYGNELDTIREDYVKNDEEWANEEFIRGLLFTIIPLTVDILIVAFIVSKLKREKDKELQKILATPISTIASEEVEELKKKYDNQNGVT